MEPDACRENSLQPPLGPWRTKLASIAKLPAILFLGLSLASVPAHADDNALIREGNAALAQRDFGAAFSIFSVLARRGNAEAQFNVGAFYLNGQGVQRDERQAYYWFERSAAQGNARAMQVIQNSAVNGNGNAKNAYQRLILSASADPPANHHAKAGANTTTAATHAAARQADDPPWSGFSVGVSAGRTDKMTGIDNSNSFGLLAGYRFTSWFGIELAYAQLYRNANANRFVAATAPGTAGRFDLNAASLTGQYIYPFSSNWSLLANLGVHSSRYKVRSSPAASRTGNSHGVVAGLKIQYDPVSSVGIRGGFDTYTEIGGLTGMLTEAGIAVIFKF